MDKKAIRKKYKESAKVFINAYGWFVKEAQHIVPKPEGAEYPYWAFTDLYNVDQTGDGHVLTLDVPIGEAILFDMFDWTKIMQMHYIGENESEESAFSEELRQQCWTVNPTLRTRPAGRSQALG